jgi:hypothetical protein
VLDLYDIRRIALEEVVDTDDLADYFGNDGDLDSAVGMVLIGVAGEDGPFEVWGAAVSMAHAEIIASSLMLKCHPDAAWTESTP